MARIVEARSGHRRMLAECTLIGRAPGCDLRLSAVEVSAEHAAIRRVDRRWRVVDLGSRNGTWMSGRRLDPGTVAALDLGTTLTFGPADNTWVLDCDEPPEAFVRCDARDLAIGRGLALPSERTPQLQIWPCQDGVWLIEDEGGQRHAVDREIVRVGTMRWQLHLPTEVAQTAAMSGCAACLDDAQLLVWHDRTEERVVAELRWPAHTTCLGSRAHHAVLLELVRARLEDRQRGFSSAEQGWVHREELSQRLNVAETHLNILIYRLRRQLADEGVVDASRVVERQHRLGLLRIGIERVSVERI